MPSSASASPSTAPSASAGADEGDGGGGSQGGGSGEGGSGGDGEDGGGEDADFPAPEKASDACRPSDVVLTLDADRSDYAWDAEPELELNAVNTGDQTCTVDLGPETVELRVTSGDDRIFSTLDCAEPEDAQEVRLKRGVPGKHTVTWDRSRSWKDCRGSDAQAQRPGTYVATIEGDYASGADSESAVFRLN